MNWNGVIILLLTSQSAIAQENENPESTTLSATLNDQQSATESGIQLDTKLRTALLRALTDLENEENSEIQDPDSNEDSGRNIEKAQASAVTIFENGNVHPSISSSEDQSEEKDASSNKNTLKTSETISKAEEDPSRQKAEIVIFQKSEAVQGHSITSLEKNPLDPFKDAEQIITSASNSFLSENTGSKQQNDVALNNRESVLQNKQKGFQTKTTSFTNLNTIFNSESKKSSKNTIVEKFSIGKAVDEPDFVKTYVSPLGRAENGVGAKNSKNSIVKNVEEVTERAVEVSTEESEAKVEQVQFFSAPLVAAFTVHQDEQGQPKKVEPIYKIGVSSKKEKVTPIQQNNVSQPSQTILQSSTFNNFDLQQKQHILEQELEKLRSQQQNLLARNNFASIQHFNNLESNNQGFTQTGFNKAINQNFNQFDPIFTEPDRSIVTKLATIDPINLVGQNSGQLLNRFTPNEAIFSRINLVQPSIPNQIKQQSKSNFQGQKASGEVSVIPSISFDPLVESGKLPQNAQVVPNKEPTGFHSYVKLPNSQKQHFGGVSPNLLKPSPSFNAPTNQNFVTLGSNLLQHNADFSKPSINSISSNGLPLSQQNSFKPSQSVVHPSSSLIQPSIGNFVGSSIQSGGQNFDISNFLNNQPNQFLRQEGFNNQVNQNNQILNQNRVLRQEQGTSNLGFNQNTFSIVPAEQPFAPKHELGYFPDNNRFLRQNEAVLAQSQQNFVGQNLGRQNFITTNQNTRFLRNNLEGTRNFNTQNQNVGSQGFSTQYSSGNNPNQNRFFRSNLESSQLSPQKINIQQSIQPFGLTPLSSTSQSNRFFRSSQEGTPSNSQSLRFSQSQNFPQNIRNLRSNQESTRLSNQQGFLQAPLLQNYKYSNPFGYPSIPLH